MSFVIDHFEDTTKWTEHLVGTGEIPTKTMDLFEAKVNVADDISSLRTISPHDLTSTTLEFKVDRKVATTGITIRNSLATEGTNPSTVGYTFLRDMAYGIIVWYSGGVAYMGDDPVSPDMPAEMRVTISDGEIIFYYDGVEVYREAVKSSLNIQNLYVYLVATASRGTRTQIGTSTFVSSTYVEPLAIDIEPLTATLQVGQTQTFQAFIRGGEAPYTVEWVDNASQLIIGTGETYVFIAEQEGNYEIYARATDNLGAIVNSEVATITVTQKLTAPLTVNSTVNSTSISGSPFTLEKVT